MLVKYTINSMVLDLAENAISNEKKRAKCLNRLHTVINMLATKQIIPDPYIVNKVQIAFNLPVIANNLNFNLLNIYANKVKKVKKGDKIILNNLNDDSLKKFIERTLTDEFTKSDETYNKTCKLFTKLVKHLNKTIKKKHSKYYPLDAIIRFKGSMQIKQFLKDIDQDTADTFSNSDNDTSITINPDLPKKKYKKIFNLVSDIIFNWLKKWENKHGKRYFKEEVKRISETTLNYTHNNIVVLVKPVKTNALGFDYKRSTRFDAERALCYEKETYLRVQRNFVIITDQQQYFELIRVKMPFSLGHTFSAEILDISMPHRKGGARSEYEKLKYFDF